MKLENKIILVTGAGNGIGREIALNLLKRGARVVGVDVDEKGMAETSDLAGERRKNLSNHRVDITKKDALVQLRQDLIAQEWLVDGVINNAGVIQPFEDFVDLDAATVQRVMEINLMGTIELTRIFLPDLMAREEASIVNVSSMGGFLPVPGQTIYGASKAGVKLFTEGLMAELMKTNVHVTLAMPGGIETDIAANSQATLPVSKDSVSYEMTSPVKAAEKIVDAMARNKQRVLIGSDAVLMNVLYRLSPRLAMFVISKFMGFLG